MLARCPVGSLPRGCWPFNRLSRVAQQPRELRILEPVCIRLREELGERCASRCAAPVFRAVRIGLEFDGQRSRRPGDQPRNSAMTNGCWVSKQRFRVSKLTASRSTSAWRKSRWFAQNLQKNDISGTKTPSKPPIWIWLCPCKSAAVQKGTSRRRGHSTRTLRRANGGERA